MGRVGASRGVFPALKKKKKTDASRCLALAKEGLLRLRVKVNVQLPTFLSLSLSLLRGRRRTLLEKRYLSTPSWGEPEVW